MSQVLSCSGCGKDFELKEARPGHIGAMQDESGFFPLMSHNGSTVWLCTECREEASELAAKFFAIVKNQYVSPWYILTKEQQCALEM